MPNHQLEFIPCKCDLYPGDHGRFSFPNGFSKPVFTIEQVRQQFDLAVKEKTESKYNWSSWIRLVRDLKIPKRNSSKTVRAFLGHLSFRYGDYSPIADKGHACQFVIAKAIYEQSAIALIIRKNQCIIIDWEFDKELGSA